MEQDRRDPGSRPGRPGRRKGDGGEREWGPSPGPDSARQHRGQRTRPSRMVTSPATDSRYPPAAHASAPRRAPERQASVVRGRASRSRRGQPGQDLESRARAAGKKAKKRRGGMQGGAFGWRRTAGRRPAADSHSGSGPSTPSRDGQDGPSAGGRSRRRLRRRTAVLRPQRTDDGTRVATGASPEASAPRGEKRPPR